MMRRSLVSAFLLVLVAALAVAAAGCRSGKGSSSGTSTSAAGPAATVPARPITFALPTSPVRFGSYAVVPLLGRSAPPYAGPATPHSLSGVSMVPDVRRLLRNPGVAEALAKNGFVVVSSDMRLFQYPYEGNVY